MTNDYAISREMFLRPFGAEVRTPVALPDVFSLVVPLFQAVEIQIAGQLLLSDLLLVAALPIALARHSGRLRQKPVPLILALGLLWFASQVITDLVRGSASEDYLRGWTKIVFVLVNFVVVWTVICRSRRRFVLYGIGLALGTIIAFYLHPSNEAISSPWKFGLGIPITMVVAMLAAHFPNHRLLGILGPLGLLAVVHSFYDFRILAAISLLSAIYAVFQMSSKQKQRSSLRMLMLAATVACALWGFKQIYSHFAEIGVFGDYARQKLAAQSGESGVLLGGRSEILASSQAILDSPLIGHGSWARDTTYGTIMVQRRAELGYKTFQNGRRDDLIPTHSYIFGSWVDGGLAGGVFWIFIWGFTITTLLKVSGWEPLLPLFAFVGFMLLWDILFSPLGTPTRFVAPYFVATMVYLRSFQDLPMPYPDVT